MIQVKNGKIVLSKVRELSPKQVQRLESLSSEQDRKAYLLSCLGLQRARHLPLIKLKAQGRDALASKGEGEVQARFRTITNNGGNVDHKPLERGQWIGVEVECLIPSEGSTGTCGECGGDGYHRVECGHCDGSGEVEADCGECDGSGKAKDSDGNEVDCAHCDGTGKTMRECPTCEGSGRESIECEHCGGSGEVERDGDSESLHSAIRSALKSAKVYRASVRSDGSLSGDGMTGVEVTILLNTDNGWEPLERALRVLRSQFNAEVNKTCGLHVHFDFRKAGRDAALEAGRRIGMALPALSLIVPESRRDNHYCKLSVSKFRGCRYHAVNLTAFDKHGSLEVRLHGGTLEVRKIERWVTLLRKIMATPRPARATAIVDLQGLMDAYRLDDAMCAYLDERWQKFNADAIARDERARALAREAAQAMASDAQATLQNQVAGAALTGVASLIVNRSRLDILRAMAGLGLSSFIGANAVALIIGGESVERVLDMAEGSISAQELSTALETIKTAAGVGTLHGLQVQVETWLERESQNQNQNQEAI